MKKLFAFVLSTAMLFSLLTGCGGGGASSSQPAPSSSAPQSEASGGSEAATAHPKNPLQKLLLLAVRLVYVSTNLMMLL